MHKTALHAYHLAETNKTDGRLTVALIVHVSRYLLTE